MEKRVYGKYEEDRCDKLNFELFTILVLFLKTCPRFLYNLAVLSALKIQIYIIRPLWKDSSFTVEQAKRKQGCFMISNIRYFKLQKKY